MTGSQNCGGSGWSVEVVKSKHNDCRFLLEMFNRGLWFLPLGSAEIEWDYFAWGDFKVSPPLPMANGLATEKFYSVSLKSDFIWTRHDVFYCLIFFLVSAQYNLIRPTGEICIFSDVYHSTTTFCSFSTLLFFLLLCSSNRVACVFVYFSAIFI